MPVEGPAGSDRSTPDPVVGQNGFIHDPYDGPYATVQHGNEYVSDPLHYDGFVLAYTYFIKFKWPFPRFIPAAHAAQEQR